MPFESPGNQMKGTYYYKQLETRLRKIRDTIDEETHSWVEKGAKAHAVHDRVSSNLQYQFSQCHQYFSTNPNGLTITLETEKDNPFVWTMVPPPYFPLF
jgi:ubiquitin-conjugating enzyme E2 Z